MVTAEELLAAASAEPLSRWKPLDHETVGHKRCGMCGQVKLIEEFRTWLEHGTRVRRESRCKACAKTIPRDESKRRAINRRK